MRIYLNDGKNSFTEKYFYPINGASKVVSEDFDKDGDLDFAVISIFPEEKNQEGFFIFKIKVILNLMLNQKGEFKILNG